MHDIDVGRDEFLYRLHRGTSLLISDSVEEARHEFERALALRPEDAKNQDLLAAVYFRLGLYPRAIELWSRLVEAIPGEVALRVNLGLVLFKTGQSERAKQHIDVALELDPTHSRAQGYLGLIHWRAGRIEEARDAFVLGGQHAMAQRMDEALNASSAGTLEAPSVDTLVDHDRAAMRTAAKEALEQIERRSDVLELATSRARNRRPSGAWQAVELGEELVTRPARVGPVHLGRSASSLATLLGDWTVALGASTSMMLTHDALHFQATCDVVARLTSVLYSQGTLESTPLEAEEESGLVVVKGPVRFALSIPSDVLVVLIDLEDQILFVHEQNILAFDSRVASSVVDLSIGPCGLPMVQLHGRGTLALRAPRTPTAIPVRDGEVVRVAFERVVGWCGRLFPSMTNDTSMLVFQGSGSVLLS